MAIDLYKSNGQRYGSKRMDHMFWAISCRTVYIRFFGSYVIIVVRRILIQVEVPGLNTPRQKIIVREITI